MSTPIYDNVTRNALGEKTLSPNRKVKAGILFGAIATIAVAALSAVTPDMLGFAGQFTPVVFAAVGALSSVLASYAASPH